MCIEPVLTELSGETMSMKSANTSSEARVDISARGIWSRGQRAFLDVRVFDPLARRYQNQTLKSAYRSHEMEKKRSYNERILHVENGSFTPLVFSALGGMGAECSMFYKRLSGLISEKRKEKMSVVSTWLRTKLSFALLRSSLLCVRGTRSRYHKPMVVESDIQIDMVESVIREL